MDLSSLRRSGNVEDRRFGGKGLAIGGGIGGLILTVIIAAIFGVDPSQLMSGSDDGQVAQGPAQAPPRGDPQADIVQAVLGSTADTWAAIFSQAGQEYPQPRLVLYRDAVQSACGFEHAATGPFYCPGDRRVYLDLSFFDVMGQRFGAAGDFARAYVIAHEVGHHVQNVTGESDRALTAMRGRDRATQNSISVRLELQADCYAGVWAARGQKQQRFLEPGDIEEALGAAAAIGDDTLQKNAGRRVTPESFTHGTSEQRVRWFNQGYKQGSVEACDTFSGT
jgi:uncharacterized protein